MIDYITDNIWPIWAAAAVLCLIAELCTAGFYMFCFAIGCIAAVVSTAFGGIYVQISVFIVVSTLSIFMVRPFALRWLNNGGDNRKTNADALIGCKGIVSQAIGAGGYGRVAVGGDDWKAESESGEAIAEGTRVVVTGRESVIIKVSTNINN